MIVQAEPVMGTVVSFHVFSGPVPEAETRAAVDKACELLHRHDEVFSTWRPESPMSRLRTGELALAEAPPEIAAVLELCREAKQMTCGWFDPWAMPGGVDPTGLVKGWAAARALEVLERAGVDAAIVNAGGDVASLGRPPGGGRWKVGINHPWRADALACVLEIEAAVATSGCYERGAHLIDPTDGSTPTSVASATVTGPHLAFVDALATAVAVAGDRGMDLVRSLEGYDAYIIRVDGTEDATAGIAFADALDGSQRTRRVS